MKERRAFQAGRGPTIHDVADAAGVSIATVSRVVRGHQDVRQETRAHVRRIIDRLGYRPSGLARALVSGYSRMIGLLVSDITNPFYPQLAKSIERTARKAEYAVVICNTEDEPEESLRYVQRLLDHGAAGVVHASAGLDEDRILEAIQDPRRIVFANRRPASSSVSYVVSDNAGGARLLAEHLIAIGHRRIGFIAGPPWAVNSRERLEGLRAAAAGRAEIIVDEGDFAPDRAVDAIRAWLSTSNPPSAFVGVNDQIALGALAALLAHGIQIPSEAAVAGFDNIESPSSRIIGLTTVSQHIDEMGGRAVRMLLRQLDGSPYRPSRVELKPTLLVRRTSDPAAEADGARNYLQRTLVGSAARPSGSAPLRADPDPQ
jgi:LacI family transcriptional regulator